VLIVKEIPKSVTGKLQRIGLAEKFGLTGPSKTAHAKIADRTAPQTPVEEKLAKIWVQVLGLTTVGIYNNFFDLGGHSVLAAQLIKQIQQVFGKRLPLTVLFQAPTIEQLAKILDQEKSSESGSSLVPIQPYGSNLPFFCVHGTHSYVHLAHYLGANQPLYGLAQHLTGKQVRYTSVQDIAAHYLEEVRTVQPKGPYFLGGHSFGAMVAFEMAQQLSKLGESISLLALIEPAQPNLLSSFADSSPGFDARLRLGSAKLHALSLQGKLNYIVEKGRERIADGMQRLACRVYHFVGLSLPPSLQRFYVDKIVYGAIYPKASEAYVPQIYPGNVIIFQAGEDSCDAELGWQELVSGGLEIQKVSGDHLSILSEPHVRLWAEVLKTRLQSEATGLSDA
jgi:thioesterase domain-containing protein/acyl carrier protein